MRDLLDTHTQRQKKGPNMSKTVLRQASSLEPLLKGLLRSLGGSEANFLELCFGWFPFGNFHTKATSKKFRPPSGNFRPNPPELPRSPSRSSSSEEAGRKIVLMSGYSRSMFRKNFCNANTIFRANFALQTCHPQNDHGQRNCFQINSKGALVCNCNGFFFLSK